VGPGHVRRSPGPKVGTGAEDASHARQDNDANVRIVIARAHVFADLADGSVFFRRANKRVQTVGTVEPDPEDSVLLRLIREMVDQRWSHACSPRPGFRWRPMAGADCESNLKRRQDAAAVHPGLRRGGRHINKPATPEKVWRLLNEQL